MALALCNVSIVCRSQGKSAVATAAYRAREKLKNEYNGIMYNYSRLKDAIYTCAEEKQLAVNEKIIQKTNFV